MNRALLVLLIAIVVLPFAAADIRQDGCYSQQPFTCRSYIANWGSNGSDGQLQMTFTNDFIDGVGEIANFTELTARAGDWACVLRSENAGAWNPDSSRTFIARNCSFVGLNTSKLDAGIYINDEHFGRIYATVRGSPYPGPIVYDPDGGPSSSVFTIVTRFAMFIFCPLLAALLCVRFLRKYLFWVAWSFCILLLLLAVILIAPFFLPMSMRIQLAYSPSPYWDLAAFLFMPWFIAPPAVLALVSGVVDLSTKHKRWSLLIPILVGMIFVLWSLSLIVYL